MAMWRCWRLRKSIPSSRASRCCWPTGATGARCPGTRCASWCRGTGAAGAASATWCASSCDSGPRIPQGGRRLTARAPGRKLAGPARRPARRQGRARTMTASSLRAMTRSRALTIGHFLVEFVTPGIGHMLKNAGCEFTVIDMEHSAFGYETVKAGLRFCEAADLPAIVRTPSRDYHHIARACDCGAEGIMLPMVGSAAEARQILDAIKYHAEG